MFLLVSKHLSDNCVDAGFVEAADVECVSANDVVF